ncbi:hypothetical protein AVEN_10413-1 [Araneus ventricosus]|uniref:Uncharacterized protein n=1 Tax=Araneus ventricosus TaxID=182803 RepID=A0A4Y2IYS0_ARAVE|nr:hypothetical protein AVEN_10413-1 [Araneus ventricosus]
MISCYDEIQVPSQSEIKSYDITFSKILSPSFIHWFSIPSPCELHLFTTRSHVASPFITAWYIRSTFRPIPFSYALSRVGTKITKHLDFTILWRPPVENPQRVWDSKESLLAQSDCPCGCEEDGQKQANEACGCEEDGQRRIPRWTWSGCEEATGREDLDGSQVRAEEGTAESMNL